jgi:STE24 endopeptidase
MLKDFYAILSLYLVLRAAQHVAERWLARLNRSYWSDAGRLEAARVTLGISAEDMAKTRAYSEDKFQFSVWASWIGIALTLVFLAVGGLGWIERAAVSVAGVDRPIIVGLAFFGFLGLLSFVAGLPVEYYRTFVIEAKHGFNRQTPVGFWLDRVKGIVIGVLLGAPLIALILWIMQAAGAYWWVYAWIAMSSFTVLTAWLYPTLLAPLFNKFTPLGDGELKTRIDALAAKIGFGTDGIYLMDASKRSSHGNAYFTGVFGKKRIVLFDTLVSSMGAAEVVAVLAHELGHFKLHHVRWQLIRGVATTGLTFFLLSLCLPLTEFYQAFGLSGVSTYGALIVFGLWFGLADFFLGPFENYISRRHEFAADAFAVQNVGGSGDLGRALLKLREANHAMPLSHPVFSSVYHSHPPILERLAALGHKPQAV